MYCFSGVVGGGSVNFCRAFAFRSFSQKLEGLVTVIFWMHCKTNSSSFSSPGRSPGRAIVLPSVSALASGLALAVAALAKC